MPIPGLKAAIGGLIITPVITIVDDLISDIGLGAGSARYQLDADGDITQITLALGTVDIGDWIIPKSAAGGNYEVRATLQSGDTPIGTLGSWLSLGTNRGWTLSQSGVGTKTCDLLIEIRLTSSGLVLDSATITLEAEGF